MPRKTKAQLAQEELKLLPPPQEAEAPEENPAAQPQPETSAVPSEGPEAPKLSSPEETPAGGTGQLAAEPVSPGQPQSPPPTDETPQEGGPSPLEDVEESPAETVPPPELQQRPPEQEPTQEQIQARRRSEFYHLDFKELDRGLSPEQLQEWQAIYASYRAQSILTGEVIGVDTNTVPMKNPETGQMEDRTIRSLVIVSYRVKVMIPETELWYPGEERPEYVARSMVGAKVDYVIMAVDRPGDCAVASRRMALQKQRRRFRNLHEGRTEDRVPCRVLAVGPKRCLVECGGFDVTCSQRDLSYSAIADLRTEYHPGQELEAVFKGFLPERDKPDLSVKEVNPNPFDGAEMRHPVGCRRQAVISGKYAGGIFCTMKDGVTCLCLYSNTHFDTQFSPGDTVLIHITHYDNRRKLIYARILSKW